MAHSLLNRCEKAFPNTAKDPHHKYLRKVSTKNSLAGTPAPSLRLGTRLQSPDDLESTGSNSHGTIAAVIAMLLIPALVVGWLHGSLGGYAPTWLLLSGLSAFAVFALTRLRVPGLPPAPS